MRGCVGGSAERAVPVYTGSSLPTLIAPATVRTSTSPGPGSASSRSAHSSRRGPVSSRLRAAVSMLAPIRGGCGGARLGLGVGPPRQPLVQGERVERAPFAGRPRLHRLETPAEARIRRAQRVLRLDAQAAGDGGEREEQVAQLVALLLTVAALHRPRQLARLLAHLLQRAVYARPLEADLRRLLT